MDAFQFFFITGIIFLASGCTPAVARYIGISLIAMAFVVGIMTNTGLI